MEEVAAARKKKRGGEGRGAGQGISVLRGGAGGGLEAGGSGGAGAVRRWRHGERVEARARVQILAAWRRPFAPSVKVAKSWDATHPYRAFSGAGGGVTRPYRAFPGAGGGVTRP